MLRVLVVEDDWQARNYLVQLLQQTGAAEVVAAVATLTEAQQMLSLQAGACVDVAFVDVQLSHGGPSGLDLVRAVNAEPHPPRFVLATAYAQHALKAYELGVADYLVKPFTAERVAACVQRLLAQRPPDTVVPGPGWPLRIAARRQRSIVFLDLDDVWACEAADRLTYVHASRGRYDLDLTLSTIASSFGRTLVRVHRNWLVNAARVLELTRDPGEMSLLVGPAAGEAGVRVPVAKERATEIRDLLLSSARGVRSS